MATIPHVSPDTVIEAAVQNTFIDEVNNVCAKRTAGTGSPFTGTLIVTAAPGLALRRTGDNPYMQLQTTAGTMLAQIAADGSTMTTAVPSGTSFKWIAGAAELLEITASTLKAQVAGRFGHPSAAPLQIVDTNGGAGASTASIAFYPSATSIDSIGTAQGHVGFAGTGMELSSDIGDTTVASSADVVLAGASDIRGTATTGGINLTGNNGVTLIATGGNVNVSPSGYVFSNGDGLLVGKPGGGDPAAVGVEIYTQSNATPTVRGVTRSTVGTAGNPNLYLRHVGTSSADTQPFIQFVNAAGTVVGSITQQGAGIRINNDLLVADLEARIATLESRLATLEGGA